MGRAWWGRVTSQVLSVFPTFMWLLYHIWRLWLRVSKSSPLNSPKLTFMSLVFKAFYFCTLFFSFCSCNCVFVCACVFCVCEGAHLDQKRALDHPGVEISDSYKLPDVGAENWTQVLWESSKCFNLNNFCGPVYHSPWPHKSPASISLVFEALCKITLRETLRKLQGLFSFAFFPVYA